MDTKLNLSQNNAKDSSVILTSESNEMGLLKAFEYNGNKVSFIKTNYGILINATDMARAFDKKPSEYLRLSSVNELVKASVRLSHTSENQLVIRLKGNPENGAETWLYEDIAIDFARWLSVDFRVWCNAKIKELLTSNSCNMPDFTNPAEAAEAWAKEYRNRVNAERIALEERARADQEKLEKDTAVKTLISKQEDLEFAESFVEPGSNDMLIREVAKKLEQNNIIVAEKTLRIFLQKTRFFTKREEDNQYKLYADIIKKGYAHYRSFFVDKYSGEKVHKQTIYITGSGYRAIAKAIKVNRRDLFLKLGGKFIESCY